MFVCVAWVLTQQEQVEVEEDDAASLRRPANDITAKLKIDFGSLGRPSRGTRGRGGVDEVAQPHGQRPFLLRSLLKRCVWLTGSFWLYMKGFQTTVEGSKVFCLIPGASCICELHYNCLLGFVLCSCLDAGIPLSWLWFSPGSGPAGTGTKPWWPRGLPCPGLKEGASIRPEPSPLVDCHLYCALVEWAALPKRSNSYTSQRTVYKSEFRWMAFHCNGKYEYLTWL